MKLSTPDFSHYAGHIQYLTLRVPISVEAILKSTVFMFFFTTLLNFAPFLRKLVQVILGLRSWG